MGVGVPDPRRGAGAPEVLERRPGWAEDAHRLQPLADADMRALLGGLVPGLPERAVAQISERAEGIPLYAVETVRMMLDRGVLEQQDDVYVVTGDVDDVKVPETLHALVASRLDNLTATERRLVQDASVLGATFTVESLVALSEMASYEVQPVLDSLVGKQILEHDDDPTSPERGQYGFMQALLQTVAYGTLGRKDRKARHLRVADYLARAWENGAEDYAEVLATHYSEAVKADPDADDVTALRASAREALAWAGHAAASLALGPEAQRYFDQPRRVAEGDVERVALFEQAGVALGRSGDAERRRAGAAPRDRARPAGRQGVGRLGRGGPGGLARGSRAAGGGARAIVEPFLTLDDTGADKVVPAEALAELATVHIFGGDPEAAGPLLERRR